MACSKTARTVEGLIITIEEVKDRIVMIVKPEQSGKTFIMIELLNGFLQEEQERDVQIVNFILCDNSLLLTTQTKKRVAEDVGFSEHHLDDIKDPYVELSSRKDDCARNHASEVREAIEDGTRNVISCTNTTRVKDIIKIIDRLNNHNMSRYNFNVWLDEADKYINYIATSFIPLLQQHENVNVFLLTATPQPIFQKYKEFHTMALENTTLPEYHGWNDCDIVIRADEAGSTIGFARQIADEMLVNGELVPGAKGYVPANTQKKSHKAMKDMFIMKGVAVFTVNGEGIELALPRDPNAASSEPPTPIVIPKKKEELHKHIIDLYTDHNVSRWPCVVTGNICVGRGISIQQPDFMFNFSILSNCAKKTEASQNAGRLKGNFKEWPGYAPRVYTTEKFNKIATDYERQSREIAKIAFKKVKETGTEEDTAIVTNVDIKNTLCKEWKLIKGEFDTLEEASKFLKDAKCRGKTAKSLKKDDDGFILSSTTGSTRVLQYDDVKKEMESWATTSNLDTRKDKCAHGRIYVTYKDIKDKESVKYLVRIAVKQHDEGE